MGKCAECGILERTDGRYRCFFFDRVIDNAEFDKDNFCHMFIPEVKEEVLIPVEYVLLKKGEIYEKK